MKHRKRRIAWAVTWGIVAVLLVALWVRSYSWHDTVILQEPTRMWAAGWNKGSMFVVTNIEPITVARKLLFQHEKPDYEHEVEESEHAYLGFQLWAMPGTFALDVPFWFTTIGAVVCGLIPWFPWSKRFSLRTLLIATTLLAVGLGLIVWVAKS